MKKIKKGNFRRRPLASLAGRPGKRTKKRKPVKTEAPRNACVLWMYAAEIRNFDQKSNPRAYNIA
jgi:hypothetical protein